MPRLKVLTLVGTRPEIIKLSRVIAELEATVEHVLVHTGQNYDYELNEIFFEQLRIPRPKHFLNAAGPTPMETVGQVLAKADAVLAAERPEAFLILGDTNSCLAAIAAKRRRIPIFHMEAGNRCFDDRVPEEINRRIVDHTSDINLVYTEHARRYLLDEGLRPETVIKTGSPMREVLEHHADDIARSSVLKELSLTERQYFVVSAHREENVDSEQNFGDLLATLEALTATHDVPVIVSTHPRTRKKLEASGQAAQLDRRIQFLKPLGFPDYIHLQQHARCVVSDSGTLTEESSICNFPAVMIRQAHERPEGMDEAAVIMAGLKPERVLQAVELAVRHASGERAFRIVEDYAAENVSKKVVRIILSYTDYVNRTVWKR
jgi:UDP-N-acetylglucosamine 2-epimerase (non-hydrolysing)